jgi:hypothetical protein
MSVGPRNLSSPTRVSLSRCKLTRRCGTNFDQDGHVHACQRRWFSDPRSDKGVEALFLNHSPKRVRPLAAASQSSSGTCDLIFHQQSAKRVQRPCH